VLKMCVSDIRLARLTTTQTTVFDVGGVGTLTIGPNRQRVGLFFGSNIVMLTSQAALITFTGGQTLTITGVNSWAALSLAQHGSLVQQGFSISLLVGNMTGRVTETFLTEAILSAAEREFSSPMSLSGKPGY
jgi:hypothetical protein